MLRTDDIPGISSHLSLFLTSQVPNPKDLPTLKKAMLKKYMILISCKLLYIFLSKLNNFSVRLKLWIPNQTQKGQNLLLLYMEHSTLRLQAKRIWFQKNMLQQRLSGEMFLCKLNLSLLLNCSLFKTIITPII